AAALLAEMGWRRARALRLAAWAVAEARVGRVDDAERRFAEARAEPSCDRPGDAETLDLFGACIELAREADDASDRARQALDAAAKARGADELRFAVQMTRRALEGFASEESNATARSVHAIAVGADGAWFSVDDGARTELG